MCFALCRVSGAVHLHKNHFNFSYHITTSMHAIINQLAGWLFNKFSPAAESCNNKCSWCCVASTHMKDINTPNSLAHLTYNHYHKHQSVSKFMRPPDLRWTKIHQLIWKTIQLVGECVRCIYLNVSSETTPPEFVMNIIKEISLCTYSQNSLAY